MFEPATALVISARSPYTCSCGFSYGLRVRGSVEFSSLAGAFDGFISGLRLRGTGEIPKPVIQAKRPQHGAQLEGALRHGHRFDGVHIAQQIRRWHEAGQSARENALEIRAHWNCGL